MPLETLFNMNFLNNYLANMKELLLKLVKANHW